MQSAKKCGSKSTTRVTRSGAATGDLHTFFQPRPQKTSGAGPEAPRGAPVDTPPGDQEQGLWTFNPADPADPSTVPEPPDLPMASPASSSDGSAADQDIRALLQALPTRSDIEALILKLEETHRRDYQEVRAEVSTLTDRVSTGETSLAELERRVLGLERARDQHRDAAAALQLHLEDVEDRSRRNNLRIRGIPETVGAEALDGKLQGLFREILGEPAEEVEVDRAHRAAGPRNPEQDRPRDVVCRLLRYAQKERILRMAWENGDIAVEGAQVKVLPDLSRATLRRRAMLRPVLELAKEKGHTYRWGYPLSTTFRKDGRAYTLQTPADLPGLFQFLEVDQIPVPDWLQMLPRSAGRSGPPNAGAPYPPRQQRQGRGRRRAPSGDGQRD